MSRVKIPGIIPARFVSLFLLPLLFCLLPVSVYSNGNKP